MNESITATPAVTEEKFVRGLGLLDSTMITDTAPFRYPHYHSLADTPDKLNYDRFALVVSGLENVIEDLGAKAR